MENSNQYYYNKIAEAINFIDQNFKKQPSLDEIAQQIHLSPFHFQRMFSEWVGVSPKKYLQFLSVNYAKQVLKNQSLANTAQDTGLSGTGRLHDLFVNLEGMTPGEYKNGGNKLKIYYDFSESYFGKIIVASTEKGICHIGFSDDESKSIKDLEKRFPYAEISRKSDEMQNSAISFFNSDWSDLSKIKLHLKGTEFQLKVWDALLKIPRGSLTTYGEVAKKIGTPKASRAVGTAIGNNPIAYLIPCHRVIQQSGNIGGYHWNPVRKKVILGWEAAKNNH